MKKLNKVATLFAVATLAGSALANPSTIESDNWRASYDNLMWKNGTSELCWRDANWTPATAAPDCDGAIQPKKEAPAPVAQAPAPEPEPAPAPVSVEKVTYAADAFFDFDKSTLKPEGRAKLDDLVNKVRDIELEVIIAVGHTDWTGPDAYNQKLSERRAQAVKDYLVSKGVESNRVYTEGKGESQPIADNHTREGRAKNRRVEVEVVGTR